jgi:predicted FMN-binding regulatory protein PaiB
MYLAMGGVVFVREHQPITILKARVIENIHRMNAAYQLSQNDERSLTARLGLAKIEQSLADEMAAAIREATAPQEIAA